LTRRQETEVTESDIRPDLERATENGMRKTPWLVATSAAFALGIMVFGVAAAASPTPTATETPEVEPANTDLTGTLTTVKDADGDTEYVIGTTPVSVGPSWFWGAKSPLAGLVGTTVTVTGHMDDGTGSTKDKASTDTKVRVPEFEVYAVGDKTVRAAGKPAWAGGPKAVGAAHPGYHG
jgi:hypothetical protein